MKAVDGVAYDCEAGVARITLAAPSKLNALTPAMASRIIALCDRAETEARVILLAGEGRAFCAGVDLSDPSSAPGPEVDGGGVLEAHYNPMVRRLQDLKVPLVVQVQGAAAGLGMALALMGDVIVTGESAYFLAPYARIGLLPDGGVPAMLTRSIGRIRTLQVLLLADKLTAVRALDWGLVTEVVPDADLGQRGLSLAVRLAEGPTVALSGIRHLSWAAGEGSLDDELQRERRLQATIPATEDCQEGNRAFLEKRPPRFIGR
ncbi:enoyl-CoA hydratase-related protein [uncultured Brevundimonas sp.]|uniref:enoyl-CoA hydratase-related protein n=1 Tax=uncultured Brevundimonas sp. TaxID=213418 RepID=UPI0025F6A0BA|nr:enoyl-CoA hydratase-related protein [uncultured Brevundimonas sp.]